jgi:hypothetical protein
MGLIQPKTGDKHHSRKNGDDQQFGQNEAMGSQNPGYSSPPVLQTALPATRINSTANGFPFHGELKLAQAGRVVDGAVRQVLRCPGAGLYHLLPLI